MLPAKLRKIIIIVAIVLASLFVVGYLLLNLISWVLYSRSVSNINIKKIDTVQFFDEKFGVTLVDGVKVQNVGRITVSGLSPDGTSISYYAKITLPVEKVEEFKDKNYTPVDSHKFDSEMYSYFSIYNKDFKWWKLKFEDTDYYLRKFNPETIIIFCKPNNGKVDIYLSS